MSAWEEAFDAATQRSYFFNRITGEASWTAPGESSSEQRTTNNQDNAWQQVFDDASQNAYYYNVHTGETSWTLPPGVAAIAVDSEQPDDLSYLVFAAVQLQSICRGKRARRRVARLVRAKYEVTRDPVTHQTLYTNKTTHESSWTQPTLFRTLGIHDDGDNGDDDEDDDDDFDDFETQAALDDDGDIDDRNNDGETNDDNNMDSTTSVTTAKKRRTKLRSKAQMRVDDVEDAGADGTELDMRELNVWRLSSRIWSLRFLRTLVLCKNQLTRLPSGLQDLAHLEVLDVSWNALTRLPSCLQTTTSLTTLNAAHNRIAAFSPRLWKLRALRQLDLSHNALCTLPFVEGDLKLLRETREWQVGIGMLADLRSLMLNHNALTELPRSLERCGALEFLNLSHNRITELRDEIGDLAALQCLYLHANALQALPSTIGQLARLEILELHANALATVPRELGALASLQQLGLAGNALQHLPLELGALARLSRLDVDHNAHLVTLGELFRHLPAVRVFSAAGCGLVRAESAASFLRASPVRALQLSDNALRELPGAESLASAAMRHTLEELTLRGNCLQRLPIELALHCHALRTLDVSHNKLTTLPREIALLQQLEVLRVSSNTLESLPDALTALAELRELRCDRNALQALPLALGRLTQLTHLDVAHNALTALPTSMTAMHALTALDASHNRLTRAPPAIHALRALQTCDLSSNPFAAAKHTQHMQRTQLRAEAVRLMAAREYAAAEPRFTALLHSLETQSHVMQRTQRPQLYLARGTCRFQLLKAARDDVAHASMTLHDCECTMRSRQLQRRAEARKGVTAGMDAEKAAAVGQPRRQSMKPEHDSDDAENRSSNQQQLDCDSSDDTDGDYSAYTQAAALRANARERLDVFAAGALADLQAAIRFARSSSSSSDSAELPTAHLLLGLTHMARMQFAPAIESFTDALHLVVPSPPSDVPASQRCVHNGNAPTDLLAAPVPAIAVALFMHRAEAYRLLGQLPAALADVRHVLAHHPSGVAPAPRAATTAIATSAAESVDAIECLYAREWEAQQRECFVDAAPLFRAFDVSHRLGLPRRPEIADLHKRLSPTTITLLQAAKSNFNKSNNDSNSDKSKDPNAVPPPAPAQLRLRPAARFAADVARIADELQRERTSSYTRSLAAIAARRDVLARTRDFAKEIRATLALEMEEAQQRAVETERLRLEQQAREAAARELYERQVMQYEDELVQWLMAEAQRLERAHLQQLEDAQRQTDARAAYATRLARRGGRRQQTGAAAARSGAGSRNAAATRK